MHSHSTRKCMPSSFSPFTEVPFNSCIVLNAQHVQLPLILLFTHDISKLCDDDGFLPGQNQFAFGLLNPKHVNRNESYSKTSKFLNILCMLPRQCNVTETFLGRSEKEYINNNNLKRIFSINTSQESEYKRTSRKVHQTLTLMYANILLRVPSYAYLFI